MLFLGYIGATFSSHFLQPLSLLGVTVSNVFWIINGLYFPHPLLNTLVLLQVLQLFLPGVVVIGTAVFITIAVFWSLSNTVIYDWLANTCLSIWIRILALLLSTTSMKSHLNWEDLAHTLCRYFCTNGSYSVVPFMYAVPACCLLVQPFPDAVGVVAQWLECSNSAFCQLSGDQSWLVQGSLSLPSFRGQ